MKTIRVNITIQYTETFDLDDEVAEDKDPQEILQIIEENWTTEDIPDWAILRLDWDGASHVTKFADDVMEPF